MEKQDRGPVVGRRESPRVLIDFSCEREEQNGPKGGDARRKSEITELLFLGGPGLKTNP